MTRRQNACASRLRVSSVSSHLPGNMSNTRVAARSPTPRRLYLRRTKNSLITRPLPGEVRAVADQHEAREPAAHAHEKRPALGVGPEAPHERRRPVEAVVADVPAVDRAEVVEVELHQAQEDGRVLPARLTELYLYDLGTIDGW